VRSSNSFSGINMEYTLEELDRCNREYSRRRAARRGGYLPPPREKDCPPRPLDRCCECCGNYVKTFHLDHCHETGAFRGWVCNGCNTGHGIMDDVGRLEKRVAFLKTHERKNKTHHPHQGGAY
jgi:hypothetical protein